MTSILWVDDDCEGSLGQLRIEMRISGLEVKCATTFESGMVELRRARDDDRQYDALLVDIILPKIGRIEGPYVGLKLIDHAIELGVMRIAILTVVPVGEFLDQFRDRAKGNLAISFARFEKTELFEPGVLSNLFGHLKGVKSKMAMGGDG